MNINEAGRNISHESIEAPDPHLYLLCGLQGSGKSTIGRFLSANTSADILKTDKIRRELFPYPKNTANERQAVYEELFMRAKKQVSQGRPIILDATFLSETRRAQAIAIAQEAGIKFTIIKAEADEQTTKKRLEARHGDDSTANYAIYLKNKDNFEQIPGEHLVINNSGSLEELEEAIAQYFPPLKR